MCNINSYMSAKLNEIKKREMKGKHGEMSFSSTYPNQSTFQLCLHFKMKNEKKKLLLTRGYKRH
jgi:hypothetical protein